MTLTPHPPYSRTPRTLLPVMKRTISFSVALLFLSLPARADFVECFIAGDSGLAVHVDIEAESVQTLSGGITQISHKLGKLNVRRDEVELQHTKTPSTREKFAKELQKAKKDGTADAMMVAARWALKHGLLDEFKETVDAVLAIDPAHKNALSVKELEKLIAQPLGDTEALKAFMKRYCPKNDMKFEESDHYILLHDTPDNPGQPRAGEKRRLPRAKARLELLEKVYEVFLYRFYANGVKLEIPKEKLMVLLFREHSDYDRFVATLSPDLQSAAGFWSDVTNIAVFYDQGTHESSEGLLRLAKAADQHYEKLGRSDPGRGDAKRFADALNLLVRIDHENQDIEVVSHECTHQMAGNTGLMPRRVDVPSWVHEGLATYFEAPSNATWAGIGAVNKQRKELYDALGGIDEISNVDFIITNEVFDRARRRGSHIGILHGYAQAWALTHFLMENYFEEFVQFYKLLGEMPNDITMSPELLTKVFDASFTTDRATLNREWKSYMAGLKTDRELILGD